MTDRTAFLSQRRRLRRVLARMSRQAQQACYGEIVPQLMLAELAREACWSEEHFVRIWSTIFGEPPIATARRIRLDTSADVLLNGATVSQVAECAGFSSVQAFCHAFRRQFGMSAREYVRLRRSTLHNAARMNIVTIRESISCVGIPFAGARGSDVDAIFDATLNTFTKRNCGTKEGPMFALWTELPLREAPPEDKVEFCTAVPERDLLAPVRGLSSFAIPAGDYLRLNQASLRSERDVDEWLFSNGWERREAPSIQEFTTDPVKTIPSKRQEGLLVPIARCA